MKSGYEVTQQANAESYLAVARAFAAQQRKIPGLVLEKLARCRAFWKKRRDVPPEVIDGVLRWQRNRDANEENR